MPGCVWWSRSYLVSRKRCWRPPRSQWWWVRRPPRSECECASPKNRSPSLSRWVSWCPRWESCCSAGWQRSSAHTAAHSVWTGWLTGPSRRRSRCCPWAWHATALCWCEITVDTRVSAAAQRQLSLQAAGAQLCVRKLIWWAHA